MPKEQINHPRIVTEHVGTPNERHVAQDDICVNVGWNRAGWVQVSLSMSADRLRAVAAQIGDDSAAAVYSETLSREEVNRMIRLLRKARDQAYGSDA